MTASALIFIWIFSILLVVLPILTFIGFLWENEDLKDFSSYFTSLLALSFGAGLITALIVGKPTTNDIISGDAVVVEYMNIETNTYTNQTDTTKTLKVLWKDELEKGE